MPAAHGKKNAAACTSAASPTTSAMRKTWRVFEARTRHSVMRPELKAAPQRPAAAAFKMTKGTCISQSRFSSSRTPLKPIMPCAALRLSCVGGVGFGFGWGRSVGRACVRRVCLCLRGA